MNKNLIVLAVVMLVLSTAGAVAYTIFSDRYGDNCEATIDLSQGLDADTFTAYFEDQQPNKNFTLDFQQDTLILQVNKTWNGEEIVYDAAKAYRDCYAESITRKNATGSCIYRVQYLYGLSDTVNTYTSIRAVKKEVQAIHGDTSIKGSQHNVRCMLIGKND